MWVYRKLSNLLSKLVVLNSVVILLVIFLAGISVKNYACFLVNSKNVTGQALVTTLDGFLLNVSILAFIIAGLFHYFTVKKIVGPIKLLSAATTEIKEGKSPSKIKVVTTGELKELLDNFNSMAESLSSIQENRDEMLKDIAHELRTPLTNINGYLEALQNKVIEAEPELFGSLLEESRRITRIVELITELDAWNNGRYFSEKSFNQAHINEVISESLRVFQLKLKDHFKKLDVNLEAGMISGNVDGLMQVVTNILQNILDYNNGSKLIVTGTINNGKYNLTFTHTGQFIAPDKKELIFERFYRLEESRSTKSHGAGLGLAIAKSIITAHEGKIGLHTDGINHTFWIELPLLTPKECKDSKED